MFCNPYCVTDASNPYYFVSHDTNEVYFIMFTDTWYILLDLKKTNNNYRNSL